MGYDGALDGTRFLHGIAVEAGKVSRCAGQQEAIHPKCSPQILPQQDLDVELLIERAIQVIGSREQAMRWLGTPVRALDFATPISRLLDQRGLEDVYSVLTNLEHGVL